MLKFAFSVFVKPLIGRHGDIFFFGTIPNPVHDFSDQIYKGKVIDLEEIYIKV